MKARRVVLSLILITSNAFPVVGIACLSGAEQRQLMNSFYQTGTQIGRDIVDSVIPAANTGQPLLDAILNGGANWTLDLIQQTVNAQLSDCACTCIPTDPFPAPEVPSPCAR